MTTVMLKNLVIEYSKNLFQSLGVHYALHKTLVLALLILMVTTVMVKFYESAKYTFLSYVSSPARAEVTERSLPTYLYIPSVEIGLPIEESTIKNGLWQANNDAASHLSSSAVPTESNNIVIYGKRTEDQFALLTSLRKGDEIIITTKNGESYSYTVADLLIVLPNEVSPILTTDKETLTLYTSYGFADLKRFIVQAVPTTN